MLIQHIFLFLIPVLHNQPQQSFWKQFPLVQIQKIQFSLQHPYLKQRYTYRVLQTIQMKLIILCAWAERAILVNAKTALKGEMHKKAY